MAKPFVVGGLDLGAQGLLLVLLMILMGWFLYL
jgi:hypothetical protein